MIALFNSKTPHIDQHTLERLDGLPVSQRVGGYLVPVKFGAITVVNTF